MLKFSRLKQEKIYFLILISIFVLSQTVRGGVAIILYPINILFLIALFILLYVNKRFINTKLVLLLFFIVVHSILVTILNGYQDVIEIIRMILYLYVPVLMLSIEYDKQLDIEYEKICTKTLKFINGIIYFIFSVFLLDYPTNGLFMKLLTKIATSVTWLPTSYVPFTYRYCSYLGHAIYTADIYIIFFLLNILYRRKYEKEIINVYVLYFISFLGVLSTGSKTGVFVLVVAYLYFILKGRRRLYSIILFSLVFIVSNRLGILDLVISRFFESETGLLDLTTGRNKAWEFLANSGDYKITVLSGYGFGFMETTKTLIGSYWASILNEFPLKIYLYFFGVINFIVYLYLIIVQPVIKQLKKMNRSAAVAMILIFILINTYNSILAGPDMMILYCLSFVLINLISYERV